MTPENLIKINFQRGNFQCHAEGGATKGGVSKCEQTQAKADKRGQAQANAEAKTQANASKREQTRTNANKRLHPPLLRFFTPPFAIPLNFKILGYNGSTMHPKSSLICDAPGPLLLPSHATEGVCGDT